jgi:hypothetical protein
MGRPRAESFDAAGARGLIRLAEALACHGQTTFYVSPKRLQGVRSRGCDPGRWRGSNPGVLVDGECLTADGYRSLPRNICVRRDREAHLSIALPLEPDVIAIQGALLVAFHGQVL